MGYLRPDSECTGGVQGYSAVDECWQVAVIRNQGIGIWWVSLVETLVTLWQHTHIYTHTGHFIRYTLLVPGRTPFCLHSLWHRFNKVLETFLRDFGPYWHDSIMQLLQICRLHIHDVNLPFHHIPNVLYWIEIWWLWRTFVWHVQETSLRWFDVCDIVRYPAGRSHQKMVHCSHKGMDMVSNNTPVGCGV